MEVLLKIPDSLLKDIEYLPEDVLPDILVKLILDGIKQKKTKEDKKSWDINQIVSLLQSNVQVIQANTNPVEHQASTGSYEERNQYQAEETTSIEIKEEYITSEVIGSDSYDDDDDDFNDIDLDDFMK